MSVLGGLSTLAASYPAKMRGSDEPEFSTGRCKELENYERELRVYLSDAGGLPGDKQDAAIRRYRERKKILGNEPHGLLDVVRDGARELGQGIVDHFEHTGHQIGRTARAEFEGELGRARVELQDDVGRAQAGLDGAIHGTISDVEKGVYGGLADVRLQYGDAEWRVVGDLRVQDGDTRERVLSGVGDARAQLNYVRYQFGDAEQYIASGISDVRSQFDDAERRVVSELTDARAQSTYLPEGRVASIYASPLASPRAYAAVHPAGEYLPAAAAGHAAGPAGTYNMV